MRKKGRQILTGWSCCQYPQSQAFSSVVISFPIRVLVEFCQLVINELTCSTVPLIM